MFLLYLLFLTLTNTAIGCVLAVELGYGPPSLRETVLLLGNLTGFVDRIRGYEQRLRSLLQRIRAIFEHFRSRKGEEMETVHRAEMPIDPALVEKAVAAPLPKSPLPAPPIPPTVSQPKINVEEMIQTVAKANLADLLFDDSDDLVRVAPLQELFDEDLVSALSEHGTESWLMSDKHVETSILKLNVVMMKSGRFSAELDSRLRGMLGSVSESFAKNALNELRDDCKNYLEAQAEVTEKIQKRLTEFGELAYLAQEIDYANMEQSAQIETTMSNLDHLDLSNPEMVAQKLIKELSKLRTARHRLRDQQEKAFLTVARYEHHMETINNQLFLDEGTGLRGRIGIEATLYDWWNQKRQMSRQICCALIDFVDFSRINDEYGITVGDKVIKYFGGCLEKNFTVHDLTGIYCGNCFFIATVNMGLRKTLTEVEKIRQQLGRTQFVCNGGAQQFILNATCSLTEALPSQSDTDVLKILEKVLQTAKNSGGNQTFFWDSSSLNPEAEKVSSPDFGTEYLTVDLDTI
ncbi:MAG: GGDEF domain-containing protein [Thermoguttaceae bacterium]